ncbi:MAG: WD40 repeat domain-containing protein [Pseudomonadota bacterium]
MERAPEHVGFIQAIALDADSVWFADTADGYLRRLDRATGAQLSTEKRHEDGITAIVVTRLGVVTAGYDGDIVTPTQRLRGHDGGVHCLAVRGDRIASGGFDGRVCLWDLASTEQVAAWQAHDEAVTAAAWLTDEALATGSRDRSICVWNPGETEARRRLEAGHDQWITRLASLERGARLLSLGEDGRVCLWDVATGSVLARRQTPGVGWGLAHSADTALTAMPLTRWRVDADASTSDARLTALPPAVLSEVPAERALAIEADTAALGGDDGTLTLVDLRRDALSWQRRRTRVGALSATVVGDLLVSGWQNGDVRLGEHRIARAHNFMAYCCAGLGANRVASAGFDGRIRVWDCGTVAAVCEWEYLGPYVFSLRASRADELQAARVLAIGGDAWALWSLDDAGPVESARVANIGTGEHSHGDLSADGKRVIVGGEHDGRLRLFAADGQALGEVRVPDRYAPLSDLCFTPTGDAAIVASASGCIARVDLQTAEFQELHREHEDWIRAVRVSPDGRFVASVSQNFRLRVFDLQANRLRVLPARPIDAAAFTPDGRLLGVTGDEGQFVEIDLREWD